MTTQANIPNKWYVPFANGDASRVEIPVTTSDPTRASQTLGFPPLTMQPPESGGVPPQGEDFNGGMNQIARVCWWVLNGGGWPYDSTFATNANINGYPNGAKLQSADFRGDWISTADGNTNNPDTNGTNWVPGFQYGITALTSLTGGTVTPTPAQAAKGTITLAGTLTSALTIVLPAWLKVWTIINSTTGAFVTIVKTAAGSGVTIAQDGSRVNVVGDGTNIVANTPSNTPGRLLRTTVYQRISGTQQVSINGGAFTTTGAGTHTPLAATSLLRVKSQGGGGGGAGGATASGSNVSIGAPGNAGNYGEALFTAAAFGTSQVITVGAGGTAGAGGGTVPGGSGGTSSIGSLITTPGGAGGPAGNNLGTPNVNGNGSSNGANSGANVVSVVGLAATPSVSLSASIAYGGAGGRSMFGDGGGSPTQNTTGSSATNLGAGGSGAAVISGFGTVNGGAGFAGTVIIEEFA